MTTKIENKVFEFESIQKRVCMFVDLLGSARRVRAENTNLPDDMLAQEERNFEKHLRNTFGLLYVQAPFIWDITERRAIAILKEKVRVVMPEYVKGLLPQEFDPEATPEIVPKGW